MYVKYAHTIALLLLAAASFYGGWYVNGARWEAKHSELVADYATAQVTANEAIRAQERLWQDKLAKVTNDAKIKQESLQRDSERLAATVDSLRGTIEVSTSKYQSANATIAELRRANATTELVQRELLGFVITRAESLATAYDGSRAAGLTCQSAYEAVRLTASD